MKVNLILTILHGYDYPFVAPFLKSLTDSGFTGDLVIYTSETVSKTTKKALIRQGAILVDYHSGYPFKQGYTKVFENIADTVTINNYRFVLFLQYLLDRGERYENVMLTDIRDVIFQKNPFSLSPKDNIFFFLEDPVQTFHHKFNYEWLKEATDENTAERLIDSTVSCAGVTIGSVPAIIEYLIYIKTNLMFRTELKWGLDQGIHNGYIYIVRPAGMKVFTNDDPVVATLGAYQPYRLNSAGEVVNSHGETYSVVHQYDRSSELFLQVKKKYIGSRFRQRLLRLLFLLLP